MEETLEQQVKELIFLLEESVGNKVRYRVYDNVAFKNDRLVGFNYDGENFTIEMENDTVVTSGVTRISFTAYEERIDFWIYGKEKTNRFNLFRNE